MLLYELAMLLCVQRTFPSAAATEINPRPVICTYCRMPHAVLTTGDENPAASTPCGPKLVGIGTFQTTAPVFLFNATTNLSGAPGVQITKSPSTKGDSL